MAFAQSTLSEFGSADVSGTSNYEPSDAPVVFLDQAPNQVNGLMADSTCSICGTGQQSVAENFNVTTAGPTVGITEIVIWGGYYPENIPNTTDDFTIIISQDAAGVPGAVVDARYNLQATSRVSTGVVLFGVNEYEFTFDYSASPVILNTAGVYHIEIYNNSVESGNFFWETGNLDGTNGIAGSSWTTTCPGVTWNSDPLTDLSIQINGDDDIGGTTGGVLLISENTTGADSVETWLNALGETYTRLTNTAALALPTSDWLMYDCAFYIGLVSSGDQIDSCTAYMNGGGNLLVCDNDQGFSYNSTPFLLDYLMALYQTDSGSDGIITGLDMMTGLTLDISLDPWPDDFLPNVGAYGTGVPIFLAPTATTYAGMRGDGGFFRSELLAWDPQYGGDYATNIEVIRRSIDWLADGIIPVELTSFSASVNKKTVELDWATATELNNRGFDIERNSGNGFEKIGFVPGFGTTTEPRSYSFKDEGLSAGTYEYRLKQIDFEGTFAYSVIIEAEVIVPNVYAMAQNYPNPFNPSTKINFSLAVDSKVSLKIFDVLGQEIITLVNEDLSAGTYNYDFNATNINSGVYFYKIEAVGVNGAKFIDIKKMMLLK